jgi:hypothetical protein
MEAPQSQLARTCSSGLYDPDQRDKEDAIMKKRIGMRPFAAALVLALAGTQALAAQVSGVNLDEQISVDGKNLVLNGAGLRTKYMFADVYVAALYLPQKSGDPSQIVSAHTPRRVSMVMKRDVDTVTMVKAFHEGVSKNLAAAELSALQPKLDRLDRNFHAVNALKKGDVINLDFYADGSTHISYNGQPQESIPGVDLSSALLNIWLGRNPVQDDLKKELLGTA